MRPAHGWSTRCDVTRVIDGDTLEVTVTRKIRVRLLDCWAPEVKGAEKPKGLKSAAHMKQIALGAQGTLFIPTEKAANMGDILTLGRVLGQVWVDGSDLSLAELQCATGHATKEKK